MINPFTIYAHGGEKRPTINYIADKIGVTQMSLYKWYFKGATPRKANLAMLASYMQCSKDDALATVTRCHDITKAGYKLPNGLMIYKDMLKNSHARLLSGADPFPVDTSIFERGRIEYD